jgi:hypothetical protein
VTRAAVVPRDLAWPGPRDQPLERLMCFSCDSLRCSSSRLATVATVETVATGATVATAATIVPVATDAAGTAGVTDATDTTGATDAKGQGAVDATDATVRLRPAAQVHYVQHDDAHYST